MYGECKTTCLLTSLTCSLQCQMIMSTGKYQPPLWVKQRTQCPWCSQSNVKGVFHFSRRLTQQPIYRTLQIWLKLLLESDFWPVPQLVLEHGVFADPLGLSIQSFCKIVPAMPSTNTPQTPFSSPFPPQPVLQRLARAREHPVIVSIGFWLAGGSASLVLSALQLPASKISNSTCKGLSIFSTQACILSYVTLSSASYLFGSNSSLLFYQPSFCSNTLSHHWTVMCKLWHWATGGFLNNNGAVIWILTTKILS